jgi:HAD superfamily hydrolase (TIGR01509 family)
MRSWQRSATFLPVPEVTAVFFDGDGTLWDFEHLMRSALAITLEHLRKLRPCPATSALEVDALVDDRRMVEREFSGAGLRLEELRLKAFERSLRRIGMPDDELAQLLNAVYLRERFTDVLLFEDVLPVLRDRSQRMPIGLLSNGNGYPERCGLAGLFQACLFSDDYGISKPDRRLFDIAAEAIGAEPTQLALVGDSLDADVRGALEAGWTAVWINRTGSTAPCPEGAHEITTLHDLSEALERSPG